MNKQDINRESICALADGQLTGDAFVQAVELIHSDADARRTWQSYHVVGDVLRSNDLARCSLGDGFVSRLQARLQQEEALVAPKSTSVVGRQPDLPTQALPEAANDAVFRWKLVAGFATLVAVSSVVWNLLGSIGAGGNAGPVMALSSPGLQVTTPPPTSEQVTASAVGNGSTAPMVMIRDPQLDALLAAHKQFGSGSALQGATGFLRNATFEGNAR